MASAPPISILVISYRFAPYIRQCLDSLLGQTLRPSQIVVVDDHSPDESWAIIQDYARRYPDVIEIHQPERNIGPREIGAFARQFPNRELFCWIDGDDYWHPQKLQREWEAMQATGARLAYSNVATVDEKGATTGYFHNPDAPSLPRGDLFMQVLTRRLFSNTSNMFRNHLAYLAELKSIHYLPDLSMDSGWDYEEKLMISSRLKAVGTDPRTPLVYYRKHATSFSQSSTGDAKHVRAELRIFEKHRDLLDRRSPAEAALGHLYMDLTTAAHRQHLPPEKRAAFDPGTLYQKHRESIKNHPDANVRQLWASAAGLLRTLKLHEIKEKLIANQDESALLAYLKHVPEDPQLLEAIFSLTPEMFSRLQRAYRVNLQKAR